MNKKILSALISAAAIGIATYGVNTMAATTGGTAAVDIVTAITITETTGMNFGDIATSGSGTVTLNTANAVAGGGSNTPSGGTVTSAVFAITGANVGYAITMPTDITVNSGGNSMTIDTFTFLADDTTTNGTGTIGASTSGQDTMIIGGTLNVGASQAAGAYTGTYTITALYE